MITTLMFDRTITVAPLGRAAGVLAANVHDARVLLHATADEVMRYVYVLSIASGKSLFIIAGLLIVLAIVIGLGLRESPPIGSTTPPTGGRSRVTFVPAAGRS